MIAKHYRLLLFAAVWLLGTPLAHAQDCAVGALQNTGVVTLSCDDTGVSSFDIGVEDANVIPEGGGFGYRFIPGTTGSGALGGTFTLTGASITANYDADLNGILSANNFPPFSGVWTIKAVVYSDAGSASSTICATTMDSLVVEFTPFIVSLTDNGDGSATVVADAGTEPYTYAWSDGQTTATATGLEEGIYTVTVTDATGCSVVSGELGIGDVVTCAAGVLTTTGEVAVCPGESVDLATDGMDVIPGTGGFGWQFSDVLGGTGGIPGVFNLTGASTPASYDAGLNGILAANNLPDLGGLWVIRAVVYENAASPSGSICSVSEDSIIVNFITDAVGIDSLVDNMDGTVTAFASGGVEPYAYTWSDGQTTATATGLMEGVYTVTITDDNGCATEGTIEIGGMPMEPCLDWVAPTDTTGWTDFNSTFGGAPCDDGTGCPFNEITTFEVFASEAYSVDNFQAGGTYTFSMCNGPGAGTWVPEFTIINPNGEVVAFGAGDGDGCSITWTADVEGTYLIVINEAGACGGGENTGVGNGFPALTCVDGTTMCEEEACSVAPMLSTGEVAVCSEEETFILEAGETSEVPAAGSFGWVFYSDLGGTGALGGTFILTGADPNSEYDADLNGLLSANNFPPFQGTWVIKAAVTANTAGGQAFANICEVSADSLIVNFGTAPIIDELVAGNGTATVTVSGGVPPYTYEWSDGQTTPMATDLEDGEYTVTVTDANGCTVTGTIQVMVSVTEIEGLAAYYLGPNPTSGAVDFSLQLEEAAEIILTITDVAGRELRQIHLGQTAKVQQQLDFSAYGSGVYMVRVQAGQGEMTKRVVVTK